MSYIPLFLSSTVVDIPKEIAERMMLIADHESMFQLVQLSPIFYDIFQSKGFWKKRMELWFSDYAPDEEDKVTEFVEKITKIGGVEFGSEEFISEEDFLRRALQSGRRDIIEMFSNRSNKEFLKKEARKIYDDTIKFLNEIK